MRPRIIGDDLLARDAGGRLCTRIATVFPRANAIVTLPGIHATQRVAYVDTLNVTRQAAGLPLLTDDEEEKEWANAVDLVLDEDTVMLRPDPANMGLACEADELLQEVVPKNKVKFLHVLEPPVRDAIKRRGERWRISPLPRSPEQMRRMIGGSRIAIGGHALYFYNPSSGTRILTYQEFRELSLLGDLELRRHLAEIKEFSSRRNRQGNPEVAFFMADDDALAAAFRAHDFEDLHGAPLRALYESLARQFHDAVPPNFRQDDMESPQWRSHMYAALIGRNDEAVSEEALLGLSDEFFMQVEWLPGGRIEDGELILDPVFEESANSAEPCDDQVCDEKVRGFIFNFIRDYGELEYVNIGRIVDSMSRRPPLAGRRGVYVAELMQLRAPRTSLRILRMQKWDVWEHLDEGRDLLSAILEANRYTEYVLDRRLGCGQLGMKVSAHLTARRVGEVYLGRNRQYHGTRLWSTYFERDYVAGLATDKIAMWRFRDDRFAIPFARLLGRAAAPNLIVGRGDLRGNVVFDDGDELIIEEADGVPARIVIADHTGTFVHYQRGLEEMVPAYAESILSRAPFVSNARQFADAFLDAFVERFSQIQHEYHKRQRAFDTLFKHGQRDEAGSFPYRWERVLSRLQAADPRKLAEQMRKHVG